MNLNRAYLSLLRSLTATGILVILPGLNCLAQAEWHLLDDFQEFKAGQVFTEATDIGWHAKSDSQADAYWMLEDPQDQTNVAVYITNTDSGAAYSNLWCQKALPLDGIAPGETGTLFFRSLWTGFNNANALWAIGTADKELEFDQVNGWQMAPGAWGDFNALIRIGDSQTIEHRDGGKYVVTDPPEILRVDTWYNFWMVVENTWDMSTSSATSTGVYSLYIQGPDFGGGIQPVLVEVGTNPRKDKASLRRAPLDENWNPQSIIWLQFARYFGNTTDPENGDIYLLDDIYFSTGTNLTVPLYSGDPLLPVAPSNLEATYLENDRVQLTWQDNATGEAGFKVYWKDGYYGDWIELADIPEANASGYILEYSANGPKYFIVQAYNSDGNGHYSNTAIASWKNPILQEAELDRWGWWRLDSLGYYLEVNREWIYHSELGPLFLSGDGPDSFYIYGTETDCWFWTSVDLFPLLYKYGSYSGWYYYYTGATGGDQWFARLADQTYVLSEHINDAVPSPVAPSDLSAAIVGDSMVRLSWTDNADYETGFRIFMQVGESGVWNEVTIIEEKNVYSHFLYDVDTTEELRFKVQAYNFGSDSDFSNIALLDTAANTGQWMLIDDFQQFSDGQIFVEAADIGWHASNDTQTDEYWMVADPLNADNVGMYVESGYYGPEYSNVWCQKALPGGGIAPGEKGTVYLRSLMAGYGNNWHVGTADKELEFDPESGLQTAPGAWGDFNALIRLGVAMNIEHRDGSGYVSTNPPVVLEVFQWYHFWMVMENTWDMSTSPPTSTGQYTLYMQGPDIGDGVTPTLIPVGTDPPKETADLRRAPVDADGNPQSIIWFQFATNSGGCPSPSSGDIYLIDDICFAPGINLRVPQQPIP